MGDKNFIFGIRTVIEAVNADKEIDKVLIKTGLNNELSSELFVLLRERGIPYQFVPEQKINRVTRKNHQGVLAFISPVTFYNIEETVTRLFEEGKNPLIIVLDGITDVRNFGAIVRVAECAGVDAILIPTKASVQINADAVKTSAGALHHVTICRTNNLIKSISNIKNSGLQIMSATEKASENYYTTDFKNPTAIIMGAEDKGISKELLKISDYLIKIPIFGNIKSLNVSVSAGILIYEAVKQRELKINN